MILKRFSCPLERDLVLYEVVYRYQYLIFLKRSRKMIGYFGHVVEYKKVEHKMLNVFCESAIEKIWPNFWRLWTLQNLLRGSV